MDEGQERSDEQSAPSADNSAAPAAAKRHNIVFITARQNLDGSAASKVDLMRDSDAFLKCSSSSVSTELSVRAAGTVSHLKIRLLRLTTSCGRQCGNFFFHQVSRHTGSRNLKLTDPFASGSSCSC